MSPASLLENSWIEIFRVGDYGERGRWTEQHLDQLAAAYDPRRHAAPVVLGHPADDAPAYGWVRRLRRAGQSLWAQLEKVDPALEALLRAGRFAQRSVALYTRFPSTGGPYLRHLGFLGAAPPAVKGLAPVRFADVASVTVAFDTVLESSLLSPAAPAAGPSEAAMPEPKSKLEAFFDHLRAFFTTTPGSGDESAPADSSSPFAERLAALEQRLEALSSQQGVIPLALSESEGSEAAAEGHGGAEGPAFPQVTTFVESLRTQGRFPPAFDRWGVAEFMERLAAADTAAPKQAVILSEAKDLNEAASATTPPLLAWFHDFLTRLPAVIEFGELASASEATRRSPGVGGPPVVRFTEPHRGMTVDPASVELAERAEALAAELGITYAAALARLREEARRTPTTV